MAYRLYEWLRNESQAFEASGLPPTDQEVERAFFSETGVRGVVESDFFAWPVEVEGGDRCPLTDLAGRVSKFDWAATESDVARILYQAIVPAADRKRLGEYYTPDWLASAIVDTAVTDPLNQRVFDPSCGSGTFLYGLYAVDGAGAVI